MLILHIVFFTISLLILGVLTDQRKPFNFNFQQNDYKIEIEWGEVLRYNKRDIKQYDGIVFKYNRTCAAGNLTFIYNIDTGDNLEIIIQAYKFLSNEYRLFPLRLEVNLCQALSKNLVGIRRTMKCGNFTGCPILKGRRYHICNWIPDTSQFPPFIPNGRYKLEIQGTYRDEELWVINSYGKVYRPVPWI